jgi:hypothetical protein
VSGGSIRIESGHHKIKMVIIKVSKLDSKVNQRQDPDHGSRRSIWVDPGQYNNKSCYYHILKPDLEVN